MKQNDTVLYKRLSIPLKSDSRALKTLPLERAFQTFQNMSTPPIPPNPYDGKIPKLSLDHSHPAVANVYTPDALKLVGSVHQQFGGALRTLLSARELKQSRVD